MIIAGIILAFTPITLGIAPEHWATNTAVRSLVFATLVTWLYWSKSAETASGAWLGVWATLGIAAITAVEIHLSGRTNHPFLVAAGSVLIAYGLFVPVKPILFMLGAVCLAVVQYVLISVGFTPADGLMQGLLLVMTITLGFFGSLSCGQRRYNLERLFTTQIELRDGSDRLREAVKQLEKAQEQLLTSERMATLGRLSGGIAHEISTPLAAARTSLVEITGLVDELFESVGHPEIRDGDIREILGEVNDASKLAQSATQRAANYIADLKRQTRGLGQLAEREFDPEVEIQALIQLLVFRMRRTGTRIEFSSEEVGALHGDSGKFGQVIVNLLDNAIDATVEADTVEPILVRMSAVDGLLEVRVIDHGTGVPSEGRDRVFEHLFTTKPIGKGTGLGLALCRDIVVGSFGGELSVEDTRGGGATFVVRVPFVAEPGRALPAEQPRNPSV